MPHGMAVVVNVPAVVRFTAQANPERHLRAAALLSASIAGAAPEDAGGLLAAQIETLMRATGMPNGVGGVGFSRGDVPALRDGAALQRRQKEDLSLVLF